VRMLVDAKAPLEYDALSVAVWGRQSAVVQMLMDAKANLHTRDMQDVPLLTRAVQKRALSIVNILLTADPSLLEECDSNGTTALMFAVPKYSATKDAPIVRILLENVKTHCAAGNDDEPPAKRFKGTQ